ncbi:DUF4190 domain-containing protein [Rathayibacter toxicus]|uniref:DUF4190 domain-containing protein n=1 Tax=Rathayibacter toxicus TaxID=145458 RepID=A0A2S5Y6H9_9MICO|nr:DUF4190 domain-containing protein [Rathayibacter toxicus]PPG46477.1 DUF4190 domain-containing protein [Rathayibacter toxicus]PPH23554.1 DUF4190 domain-containing protein [Rathayibacter toxicus]PPH57359.1 DUF4190 domain-containing protein [Rathayibacter toxicus]PPH59859.1 DUF4190 domain-containing protein [Rathayibacter toxicus]
MIDNLPARSASLLARYSFICGLCLLNIPAIILGHVALRRCDANESSPRRLAKTGLVLGYCHLGAVLYVFFQLATGGDLPFPLSPLLLPNP